MALNEAIRSLEAAALVCAAAPKKKAVHRLRTWTRRVEAMLELIACLPDVPPAVKQRGKAMRVLKKLRRAAGVVRDLDVEGELIVEHVHRVKGRSRKALTMRKEARGFLDGLGKQRDRAAEALVAMLEKKLKKLPLVLRELGHAFEGAEETALTETRLVALVEEWFGRCTPPRFSQAEEQSEALHALRKRAKLARYMLEISGPAANGNGADARARRLGARFQALQHAGGQWHDWMQLSDAARKKLGKSSLLARQLSARGERSLRSYQRQLAQTRA